MRFLVKGELLDKVLHGEQGREEYLHQLRDRIVPTLHMLLEQQAKGVVLGGGVIPMTTLVFIADLPDTNVSAMRRLLWGLPAFDLISWEVSPLESFEELVKVFEGSK